METELAVSTGLWSVSLRHCKKGWSEHQDSPGPVSSPEKAEIQSGEDNWSRGQSETQHKIHLHTTKVSQPEPHTRPPHAHFRQHWNSLFTARLLCGRPGLSVSARKGRDSQAAADWPIWASLPGSFPGTKNQNSQAAFPWVQSTPFHPVPGWVPGTHQLALNAQTCCQLPLGP